MHESIASMQMNLLNIRIHQFCSFHLRPSLNYETVAKILTALIHVASSSRAMCLTVHSNVEAKLHETDHGRILQRRNNTSLTIEQVNKMTKNRGGQTSTVALMRQWSS
jgi:predicted rRNA methylase YqxC with S4 and FtsJ domains